MDSQARKARSALGISIEEAARELKISGGYLSQIELGQRHITKRRADEIAQLYKVPREQIFLPTRFAIREVVDAK
jgi:transcriptional regulator with XRE-family HTH domain